MLKPTKTWRIKDTFSVQIANNKGAAQIRRTFSTSLSRSVARGFIMLKPTKMWRIKDTFSVQIANRTSGKLGHLFANRGNPDKTALYEPLIRIFTVCLVILFLIPIIKIYKKKGRCPNLPDRPNLPDFTLMVTIPTHFPINKSIV